MRPVFDTPHPLAIAHRGSRTLWPENTMEAFQRAVDLGYTWLETDLHLTRDGVVVCLHDDTLERTTDGSGPVWDLDHAELRSLDAGARHRIDDDFPFRGTGLYVPTLEEVVTSFPDVRLVVDLKQDGLSGALVGLIERFDLWDRLVVGGFSDQRLADFRVATGDRVATSTGPGATLRAWLGAWVGRSPRLADAMQVPRFFRGLPVVTKRTMRGYKAAGYEVHVWTVNQPSAMERLLDWGVDGLITDRPDLLRDVLMRRGSWTGRT